MTAPIPDVQAEKLRKWAVKHLSEISSRCEEDGSIFYGEREYEIVVQPKGLAELQEGLIEEVRFIATDRNHFSPELILQLEEAVTRYDAALASLGKRETAGGGA